MKIIDFHTHFYTLDRTRDAYEYLVKSGLALPGQDGELKGLQNSMKASGVSLSINLPAALTGHQVFEANSLMILHNKVHGDVMSLGTMHMEMAGEADFEAIRLKRSGINGIKLNPQSQEFDPDDGRMGPIYEACEKAGLFILFHAGAGAETGFDPGAIHARPKRFVPVIKNHPKLKIVLAHMGGLQMWQEAFDNVIGRDIYIDTAYTTVMDDALFAEAIKKHGASKVIFGSDFPWQKPGDIIDKIKRCVADEEDRELVLHMNAEKLLF